MDGGGGRFLWYYGLIITSLRSRASIPERFTLYHSTIAISLSFFFVFSSLQAARFIIDLTTLHCVTHPPLYYMQLWTVKRSSGVMV